MANKWANAFHAGLRRLLPFAFLGGGQTCQPTSAGGCRSAQIMKPTPSRDARQRSALLQQAMVQREILSAQWQAARKRRDMQAMHRLERDMRASVVSILIRGRYCDND